LLRLALGAPSQSLGGEMPKTNAKKRRVEGIASRGFFRRRKWIWIVLLIPAMQVAVVPRKRLRLTRLSR